MARSDTQFKAGGKPGPGRPKGRKDHVPRSFKEALKRAFEDVWNDDPEIVKAAIRWGLAAKPPSSFQYLQLMHFYTLGKPAETLKLKGQVIGPPIQIVPPGGDAA